MRDEGIGPDVPPPGAGSRRAPPVDVGVAPVSTPVRSSRRAAIVVVALAIAVIGLGFLGGDAPDATPGSSHAGPAAAATATPSRAPTPRPTRTLRPVLPELPNLAFEDGPTLVLARQEGDDLELLEWRAGDERPRPAGRLEDVFALDGGSAFGSVSVSPDGAHVLVHLFVQRDGRDQAVVRVHTRDGREAWSLEVDREYVPTIWSPDGRRLAAAEGATWHVITLGPDASASTRSYSVVGAPGIESDETTRDPPGLRSPSYPVGFSSDGTILYAAQTGGGDVFPRPAFSLDLDDGRIDPLERFPTAAPSSDVSGWAHPGIDPASGRIAYVSGRFGHPGDVVIWNGPGEPAFEAKFAAVHGLGWAGDGRLLVLAGDRPDSPVTLSLVPVDASGDGQPPILTVGPVGFGWLFGVARGYALLVFAVDDPTEALVAVVRLSDGATGSLRLTTDDAMRTQFTNWFVEP